MNSETRWFLKRGETVKQATSPQISRAISKGKILRTDLISTNKINWVPIVENPEWTKHFPTEVSMDTPIETFAQKNYTDPKFNGVLVCPQCNHDYPELADFQIFSYPRPNNEKFKGWRRFRKFPCESCGVILRKDIGSFSNFIQVSIFWGIFSGIVTFITHLLDHSPLGFGFNHYFDYQYISYPLIVACLIFSAPLFIAIAMFQEEHFQRLCKVTSKKNFINITDKVLSTFSIVFLLIYFSLGFVLNIGKDAINFRQDLQIQSMFSFARSISPFWNSEFQAIEGRLHFRKGNLPMALNSLNQSIESINDLSFPLFSRGLTHYYLADYEKAEADFQQSLIKNSGQWDLNEVYKKIWIYMAHTKNGRPGKAILESAATQNNGEWPSHLTSMLLGKKTPEQILKSLKKNDTDKRCQTYFYSGQWHLLNGNRAKARAYFLNAALSKSIACNEKFAAKYEWKALPLDEIQ